MCMILYGMENIKFKGKYVYGQINQMQEIRSEKNGAIGSKVVVVHVVYSLFSSSFLLLEHPWIIVRVLPSAVATPLLPDLVLPLASIFAPFALCG